MTVRVATQDDAIAIAKVNVASWNETYRGLLPDARIDAQTVEGRTKTWSHILRAESLASTYVYEAEGAVVGYVSATPQQEPELDALGVTAQIAALYLLQDYHRRGIGRVLWQTGLDALTSQGHSGISVSVLATNTPSVRFYEAMGTEFLRNDDEGHAIYVWRSAGD